MSKKGGGSILGRGGGSNGKMSAVGATTPRNMGSSGGRYSHLKAVETDAKYSMLMWQSKLQEKFLKEEKKQKDLSSARRKSDEDYQQTRAQNRTIPLRGGSGSGSGSIRSGNYHALRTTTVSNRNNGNTTNISNPKVNFRNESPNEFRLEISREAEEISANPPPTHSSIVVTAPESRDLSEKFLGADSASNFAPSKYLGDIQTQPATDGAYSSESTSVRYNENVNNSERCDLKTGHNVQREWVNSDEQGSYSRPAGGVFNPQSDIHNQINKTNITPMLPKIGKVQATSMNTTKLNNSISYDNLSKPMNANSLSNNHQHQQNSSVPAAGVSSISSPYNFSTNLAFFGLMGFGNNVGTCAGSPRRSPSGRLITKLQGDPEIRYHQKDTRGFDQTLRYMMDKERIQQYKEDLDKQVLENERQRARAGGVGAIPIKITSSYYETIQNLGGDLNTGGENGRKSSINRSSGMELAPLIRKYKSLPKLNTRSSTDVTKQFVASPRRGDFCLSPEPEEIAKGLSMQLAEKQRIHQITQENDRLASEKHFNTWDSFWGRPGCGAPMFSYRNSRIGVSTPSLATSRTDLFKALHMTHQNKPRGK